MYPRLLVSLAYDSVFEVFESHRLAAEFVDRGFELFQVSVEMGEGVFLDALGVVAQLARRRPDRIETDVPCGLCGGKGCRTCRYSGWLEMGGAGMVDPAVLQNGGIDPEEWSGFAFGCGLERVAQLRHNIPDIRVLWENDLRVLRQF